MKRFITGAEHAMTENIFPLVLPRLALDRQLAQQTALDLMELPEQAF